MTSGPRRIRVACAKCGYDKVRTLEAGDDRTLAQLSASLRCGGCRTWGKNGALSVEQRAYAERGTVSSRHSSETPGVDRGFSELQPRNVHGVCLVCGHNENFRPRWRREETLQSLAGQIHCPKCGANGGAGNIYLRECLVDEQSNGPQMLPFAANMIAALSWWLDAFGKALSNAARALLAATPVAVALTAVVGVGYIAVVLFTTALSVPAEMVLRAAEHERQDSIRHSPKGGYYVRLENARRRSPNEGRD